MPGLLPSIGGFFDGLGGELDLGGVAHTKEKGTLLACEMMSSESKGFEMQVEESAWLETELDRETAGISPTSGSRESPPEVNRRHCSMLLSRRSLCEGAGEVELQRRGGSAVRKVQGSVSQAWWRGYEYALGPPSPP